MKNNNSNQNSNEKFLAALLEASAIEQFFPGLYFKQFFTQNIEKLCKNLSNEKFSVWLAAAGETEKKVKINSNFMAKKIAANLDFSTLSLEEAQAAKHFFEIKK